MCVKNIYVYMTGASDYCLQCTDLQCTWHSMAKILVHAKLNKYIFKDIHSTKESLLERFPSKMPLIFQSETYQPVT